MKKSLKATLITLAVVGALVICFLVFIGITAGKKMSEGIPVIKGLSEDIMTNVVATQKYSDFGKYSNIELQSQLSSDKATKIFEMYKSLGKFVSSEKPIVSNIVTMSGGKGNATVSIKAIFENGPALISLVFIRNDANDQWQLDSFDFRSDVFLKKI